MRLTALLGLVVVFAACSKADAPPAGDTGIAATEAPAAAMSLGSVAGMWNVNVMPVDRDTVVTSYVLNTMDSTAWSFTFPNRPPIAMRVTGMRGDTLLTETDRFESSLRKGVQVRTSSEVWIQDGKLAGRTTARYDTSGPDSVLALRIEGTKQ